MHELPNSTPFYKLATFPLPGPASPMLVPSASAALGAPSLPTMFDAASVLSATSAEGSLELRQQQPAGCAHRRCRSCCGSRGFVCPAHVRPSAHVPASSQCSERQQILAAASASTAAVAAPTRKRPLDAVATPTTTTSSSVGQPAAATVLERFAREVTLDAVFRRVRLGPDDAEVAYHATVTIGGHVFRGVLYDVGPHSRRSTASSDTGGSSDGSWRSTGGGGGLDLTLRL
ncbi:protein SHI RELATED SEQUENCE 2 [Setaria italica]|uniref:protein SHI RELATED SEQUENCE 2 n=1 Tax=Setaria italica TaxID=4555 RepID=UPI0003513D87|nr:protein SHI RELATED SEQUENCE 2 [Setaria italica]